MAAVIAPVREGAPFWAHGERERFPVEQLDEFLLWVAELGGSDVALQTGRPACIEVDGVLHFVTRTKLDTPTLGLIMSRIYGPTGEGVLRDGRDLDCSYEVRDLEGGRQRFRVNMAAVQVKGAFGINITLRVLPGRPPELGDLGIEDEVIEAATLCRGLTLVTGVPGSGKSTLLASLTRRLLETGIGRVQSYEAPIEYVFDDVAQAGALMSASEIPLHFRSFAAGPAELASPAPGGGDRRRGARSRDGRGRGPCGRSRDRGLLDDAHGRGRPDDTADARGVPAG